MKTIYRFLLALILVLVFGRSIVFAQQTVTPTFSFDAKLAKCAIFKNGVFDSLDPVCVQKVNDDEKCGSGAKKEYMDAAGVCADFYGSSPNECIRKAGSCTRSGLFDPDKERTYAFDSKAKSSVKTSIDFCTASKDTDHESLEKRFDTAKDDLDKSESKLQELQDKLQEATTKAAENQDKLQAQIDNLNEELTRIPARAETIKAGAKKTDDEIQLKHIAAVDGLRTQGNDEDIKLKIAGDERDQAIMNQDNLCQQKEEKTQEDLIKAKNSAKAVGQYTMQSLNQALTTSYLVTKNGKKITRNEQQILERFAKCQQSRLYMSAVRAAEQKYQTAMLSYQRNIASINKSMALEQNQYQKWLEQNTTSQNIALSQLVTEQSNMMTKVAKLQQQKLQAAARDNQAQQALQGQIQQAQFKQMQQQQSMVNAGQALSISDSKGGHTRDDKKELSKAMGMLINEQTADCAGKGEIFRKGKDPSGSTTADQ